MVWRPVSPLPLRGGRPQGRALYLWSWQGWVTYLPQASPASFIKWEWLYLPYLPCVALKTSNYPMTGNVMKYKHHEGGQSHREKPSLELREKDRRPDHFKLTPLWKHKCSFTKLSKYQKHTKTMKAYQQSHIEISTSWWPGKLIEYLVSTITQISHNLRPGIPPLGIRPAEIRQRGK